MGHQIFDTILSRKLENFVSTFVEDSKSIFFNGTQLIHPGEYGRYRENAMKDLLQILTKYKVSDGFVITSTNKTSSQCDIVIYDNSDFPVLENNLTQFFSIESIIALGEVKSTLSKTDFKKALRKLAKNKMLSTEIKGKPFYKRRGEEYDHPISFLVCKNLNFNTDTLNFEEIYEGIPKIYWHNMILIVDQGLMNYSFNFQSFGESEKENLRNAKINVDFLALFEVPQISFAGKVYDCKHSFVKLNEKDKFSHLKMFVMAISQSISFKTIFKTHMIYYTGHSSEDFFMK